MDKSMDYGPVASRYATYRWAVPWKLEPLLGAAARLPDGAAILDVGCGTGDYLLALHEKLPAHRYLGMDLSPEMLEHARSRCPRATLDAADAEVRFPFESGTVDLVYAVDLLHHIENADRFFSEASRVLREGSRLVVITDSEVDIHARTLAEFFPTTVSINLERYPRIDALLALASRTGFHFLSSKTCRGFIDLEGRFMQALASKALSELRLIPNVEHERGMQRATASSSMGGKWLSQTTALEWTVSPRRANMRGESW